MRALKFAMVAKIFGTTVSRLRASLKAGTTQEIEGERSDRDVMPGSCQKKTPPGITGGEYF
jgi:hypothetical protein